MERIEADYLVVGSGAMGMAFADVMVTETDATLVIVDRHHQPGGHWNVAYPFVRLHQPSAFYGVNSRQLGSNAIDTTGWNRGLYELASNSEVCAYFGQVMQRQFLPSGRVRYFPLCEYRGEGCFESLLSRETYEVAAGKVVDTTYMNVTVPSVSPAPFEVADRAHCVPLNDLPRLAGDFERHVIVGAGKTGMDACLFLLAHGQPPEAITWIVPRDSWMLDRANIQPPADADGGTVEIFDRQFGPIAQASDIEDLFERMDATGQLLRLDPRVKPTMYRCATVTRAELDQLRRIENIVRLGHIERIGQGRIVLEYGTIPTSTRTLHVHCAADGLARRPPVPVFDGRNITPQALRVCQQVFSAAFIAHVEATISDERAKNRICTPVPHPDTDIDLLRTTLGNALNQADWMTYEELTGWLRNSRLDVFTPPEEAMGDFDANTILAAIGNLQKLLAEVDGDPAQT